MKTAFELQTCSRCHGSGKYSFCQTHKDRCFKCGGSGVVYTKRGAMARAYFDKLCTVPASAVQVGDKVSVTDITTNGTQYRYAGTVTAIKSRNVHRVTTRSLSPIGSLIIARTDTVDGQFVAGGSSTHRIIEGEDPSLGSVGEDLIEYTMTVSNKAGRVCDYRGHTEYFVYPVASAAKVVEALKYQASLTKQGKPLKRKG